MTKSLHTQEYNRFRRLLVAAREGSGFTQSEVALALGRPQSFVAKYERGERRLDVVEFVQICAVLGIAPAHILDGLTGQQPK